MMGFEQRLANEQQELKDKLEKLDMFLSSAKFESLPVEEQNRLLKQSRVMSQYRDILLERLASLD